MLGVPVLEGVVGAFAEEFLELVVADAAVALRGADAGFVEGLCARVRRMGRLTERDVLLQARGVAELEGGDDPGGIVAVALADADAVGLGEEIL